MKRIDRVIAEGSGKGDYIACGAFGRVYQHGHDRVYKESFYDGTGVWLERCWAIQKRLGIDHPLCEGMPEVFNFRRISYDRYEVVMRKYTRIYEGECVDGKHCIDVPTWSNWAVNLVEAVIGKGGANDLHSGNILWCCRDKRWVVVDPSSYDASRCLEQDPKFNRAKRVVTQYGPKRRH